MKSLLVILVNRLSILVMYPLILLTIGIFMHLYSLVMIIIGKDEAVIWSIWVHIFMLIFNFSIAIGIIYMKKLTYIIFPIGLILMIGTWIIDAITRRAINLSTTLAIILCTIAIPVMVILYKKVKS